MHVLDGERERSKRKELVMLRKKIGSYHKK